MDAGFWHRRWESNEIGFHQGKANALLVRHFAALALPEHARLDLELRFLRVLRNVPGARAGR